MMIIGGRWGRRRKHLNSKEINVETCYTKESAAEEEET
jgi:hypothetical protein